VDAIADAQPGTGAVRAAGGLVVRDGQVLLVHRPRFDDWSLPKGKLKRGEHPLAGAIREVTEETGVVGVPGVRLPTARYEVWSDGALVEKLVDYWSMTVGEIENFAPGDEVDEVGWMTVPEALGILTYPRDVRVLRAFSELPPLGPPVVWVRPLDDPDARQAAALARLLAMFRPGRLLTAVVDYRPTLAPLARALDIEIEVDERLDSAAAESVLPQLAGPRAAVVCAQIGPAAAYRKRARSLSAEAGTVAAIGPGDGLVFSFSGDTLAAMDPLSSGVS